MEITYDTRVVLTAHNMKATVLAVRALPDGTPYAVLDFDATGLSFRNLDLLTAIDEPAPAPKLYGSGRKSAYEFYKGGVRYEVANVGGWKVTAFPAEGPASTVVPYAETRKAAFAQALATVAAA